jgi:hypothetical protein
VANGQRYTIVLRPEPGADAPPIIRLRRLLKALKRAYRFVCVSMEESQAQQEGNGHAIGQRKPGT